MEQGQTLISLLAAESDRIIPFSVAALGLLVAALVMRRLRPRWLAVTAWLGMAVLSLGVASLASVRRQHAQQDAAREAFAHHISGLTDSVLAPGSALACLDAMAGESVESACEKQLFANPQSVAAAVAYTTSRLALLQDARSVKRADGDDRLDRMVARLQRGLETDRFGFVAHVLSARYGCKVDTCAQFALLSDASVVKINLQAGTYDGYVTKYQSVWLQDKGPAVARTEPEDKDGATARASLEGSAPHAGDAQQKPPVAHEVKEPIDFPSAEEIPPVSIMDPEPASGPLRGAKGSEKPAAPREASEKQKKAERAPPLPRSNPKPSKPSPKPRPEPHPASQPAPADAAQ